MYGKLDIQLKWILKWILINLLIVYPINIGLSFFQLVSIAPFICVIFTAFEMILYVLFFWVSLNLIKDINVEIEQFKKDSIN